MSRRRGLAARLGLDDNSLRRRTDKIAAYGAVALLVLFLAGAPIVSVVAGRWAYRASAAERTAWREVTAVLLQKAPADPGYYDAGPSWASARWSSPAGPSREGVIPAPPGTPAGGRVRIWVDHSGRWAAPPLSQRTVALRVAVAAVAAPVVLAAVLIAVASCSRWLLDRRRLAGWEAGWAWVGPQWTRQFRARG